MSAESEKYAPFAIFTYRLIVVPMLSTIKLPAYRTLYAHLKTLPNISTRAFGPEFPQIVKADSSVETGLEGHEEFPWEARGLGNCAVGLWSGRDDLGRIVRGRDGVNVHVRVVEGAEFEQLALTNVRWVGYVGVRKPRLPPRGPGDRPLPQWQEIVELRYGFTLAEQRTGWGTEAARGLMLWAEKEAGVKRFIAESEKELQVSDEVLTKVGFRPRTGVEYWKKANMVEWEREASR